ncbi:hypothetical protein J4411_02510 [Candidatus Pacearchaeota archaeon]|nr:hypothetical protein [Candidatus Pacearchaeota archaeon]
MIKFAFLGIFLALAFILINTNFVYAENNVCCEKLKTNADGSGGQWCQNAPINACDISKGLRSAPTSCESTSFCKAGTCYDSQEGICESGVSQTVCQNSEGVWNVKPSSEIPQCQLGCCYLGGGANLATQVRCKELSALYGVNTNFNLGITSEIECIASAGGEEKGACVYETGAERTCKMTTKSECNDLKGEDSNSGVEFYEGYLCSDEDLHTNCGPSKQTTCVVGQNEVYFLDTCGNLANIYDATQATDKIYWSKIVQKEDSCNPDSPNANSASCGNCDFALGSTCKAYEKSGAVKPTIGENLCKDLGCTFKGKTYKHGESWCGLPEGVPLITDQENDGNYVFNGKTSLPDNSKENLPGSVYEKLTCYNGEVTIDNCYDGRQKICVQDEIPTPDKKGFKNAVCALNIWQDCALQTEEYNCLDRNLRSCKWLPNNYALASQSTQGTTRGACVPLNPPGFDFWSGEGNGDAVCSYGTISCPYEISKSLLGGYSFASGSECIVGPGEGQRNIKPEWVAEMQNRCMSLGDCGPKMSYIGTPGAIQIVAEKLLSDGKSGDYIKSDGKTIQTPKGTFNFENFMKQYLKSTPFG